MLDQPSLGKEFTIEVGISATCGGTVGAFLTSLREGDSPKSSIVEVFYPVSGPDSKAYDMPINASPEDVKNFVAMYHEKGRTPELTNAGREWLERPSGETKWTLLDLPVLNR